MAWTTRRIKDLRDGELVRIHQFCNDWFMADSVGRPEVFGQIVSPMHLKLDPDEIKRVTEYRDAGKTGFMFVAFWLDEENGTFRKIQDRRRSR